MVEAVKSLHTWSRSWVDYLPGSESS